MMPIVLHYADITKIPEIENGMNRGVGPPETGSFAGGQAALPATPRQTCGNPPVAEQHK